MATLVEPFTCACSPTYFCAAERVPTERPASVVVVGDSGSAGKNVNRVVVDRDNECPFLVKIYIKEHQDWRYCCCCCCSFIHFPLLT